MPSSAEYAITLVDGRSGAGKSHFAAELARARDAVVVSIDDVYPGWDGLDAGSWLIHEYLVRPYLAGLTGRYRPWSWEEQRRGEWVEVSPDVPLIVEGLWCHPSRIDYHVQQTSVGRDRRCRPARESSGARWADV